MRNKRMKSGRGPRCRTCNNMYVRDYYKKNRHKQRAANIKSKYGITIADYDTMLAKQGYGCAICGAKKPGGKQKAFYIDHDHQTGEVRGLLWNRCNHGLGLFRDGTELLYNAISYLNSGEGS